MKNSNLFLAVGILFLLAGAPHIHSVETTETLEAKFSTLAERIRDEISGSVAIWRIDVSDSIREDTGLSDSAIWVNLDLELDRTLREESAVEYRYDTDLKDALEAARTFGVLQPGNLQVPEVKKFGEEYEVEYLLDIKLDSSGLVYRLLDMKDASTFTSGMIGGRTSVNRDVMLATQRALREVASGSKVFPLAVTEYGNGLSENRSMLEDLTIELAGDSPHTIYSAFYYRDSIVSRATGEEEKVFVEKQGMQVLPGNFQEKLNVFGVEYVLTVLHGRDGTIAKVIDVSDGAIVSSALIEKGLLSQIDPVQSDDITRLQELTEEIGTSALVAGQYTSPEGVMAPLNSNRSGYEDQRVLLDEYVQYVLVNNGVKVIDHLYVKRDRQVDQLPKGLYHTREVRESYQKRLGISSFVRVDAIEDSLEVSVIKADTLEVHMILSNIRSYELSGFVTWFAEEYMRRMEGGGLKPMLLYNADLPISTKDGSSYNLRLHLIIRELAKKVPVMDTEFARMLIERSESRKQNLEDLSAEGLEHFVGGGLPSFQIATIDTFRFFGNEIYAGRILDPRTRTWALIRARTTGTPAIDLVRNTFQEAFQPLSEDARGSIRYQKIGGSSLSQNNRDALLILLQSWVSTEHGWSLSHSGSDDAGDYTVVLDDSTPQGADIELYIRILDSADRSVAAISSIGLRDTVRRYEPARNDPVTGRIVDLIDQMVKTDGPVAVIADFGMSAYSAMQYTNAVKEALFQKGVPLVDTERINSMNLYNEENVVFSLGAVRYIVPVVYQRGIAVKEFESDGALVQLHQQGSTEEQTKLIGMDDFPRLSSVSVGKLSLSAMGYTVVEDEAFLRDALLSALLRGGSRQVIDPEFAPVFFQEPEETTYVVEAEAANNPVLFSINPSLTITGRTRDEKVLKYVKEIPFPMTRYTVREGEYVPTMLDRAAGQIADSIRNTLLKSGEESPSVVSLSPDMFSFEKGPNRKLNDTLDRNPVAVLRNKISARLFEFVDDLEIVYSSDSREGIVEPEMSFMVWEENFDGKRVSYSSDYEIILKIMKGDERLFYDKIRPKEGEQRFNIAQLETAKKFEQIVTLRKNLGDASAYAVNKDVSRLKESIEEMERLLPQIMVFSEEYETLGRDISTLKKVYNELREISDQQHSVRTARLLIGKEEYREAQKVIRDAMKTYGETDILKELLQQAEDLPENIIGRLSPGPQDKVTPIYNEKLSEFHVVGSFGEDAESVHAVITIRPNGVYRIWSKDSITIEYKNLDKDTIRIVDRDPEYVVVVENEPVRLDIKNEGVRKGRTFTLNFEKDNEALYRLSKRDNQIAKTVPAGENDLADSIIPENSARLHQRHRSLSKWGWINTGFSVVSLAVGGFALYAEQEDFFGFNADFDAAVADYDAALTTADVENAASRAEEAEKMKEWVRYSMVGGFVAGGVTAAIATILFISDKGYPRIDVDGPLFNPRVAVGPRGITLAFALKTGK